jgi:acyl-CoA synthetase (NDP forming)
MRDISPLVAPKSIAVVGASTDPNKSGGVLFGNLAVGGFKGKLYPINPRADEILGIPAFPDIDSVPEQVDLAYIVLPRQHVRSAIEQCAAAGVRAACIVTAGFSEVDISGRKDEEDLCAIAEPSGMLLAGPNTIGMVNAECGMMGSFINFPKWESGCISLFTQTGIFTGALMLQVMTQDVQRLPVGKSIDVGNKIDVDELDFLEYAATDPTTKVIGFYLESIRDPDRFFARAAEIRLTKPIVVLKPGRTAAGSKASAFHTGSSPTEDSAIDAGMRQAGIWRAEDEDDFINVLRALALSPRPEGKRVAIATTSGALGVMSADYLSDFGLSLATLTPKTLDAVKPILPDWLPPANPFDFWIAIDVRGPLESHRIGLDAIMSDAESDMLLCTLLAPANADFPEFGDVFRDVRARNPDKPVVMVIYGGPARERWIEAIEGLGIPVYNSTRPAVRALAALTSFGG